MSFLQCELDGLSESERQTLCRAALLDRPFSKEDLFNVADLTNIQVHDALEKFTERKLLLKRQKGTKWMGYQFRTSSLRQVAEDSLTLDDRRKQHRFISEYLRTAKADPALIAAHYLQGQTGVQALSFTLEAIHIATASYALQRAMAYLSQAKFLVSQTKDLLTADEEVLSRLQMTLVQAEIAFYNGDTESAKAGLDVVLNDSTKYNNTSGQTPQFRHSLIRMRAFATFKLGGNLARLAKSCRSDSVF